MFSPQTAATTFAFSSVFILLLQYDPHKESCELVPLKPSGRVWCVSLLASPFKSLWQGGGGLSGCGAE